MNAVLFVVVLDVLSDVVACDVIFDIIFVVNVKVNVDINVLSHHITVLLLLSSWVFRIRTKQTIPWEGRKDRSERKGIHNSQKHLQSRDGRLMPARSRLRSDAGKKSSEKRAAKTKDAADKEATTAKPKDVCFQFCDGVVLMS